MPTETTTTDTKPAAGMRDALLDIAAAANDALYTSHATPEAAEKAYADALDLIRKRLGADGAYFTPTALLAGGAAHRSCFDALEEDYNLRLAVFRTPTSKKFVGVRRPDMDHPNRQARLWEVDDDRRGHIVFKRDGETLAEITMHVMKTETERLVCRVIRTFLGRTALRAAKYKRAKARAAAAAAAEHPIALVNPPMVIPPRPGLPEDDE